MFNKVVIDLLFNLLLIFVSLFFLSFILIKKESQENSDAVSKNNILITMIWETDTDVDLWLKLPDERLVYYGNRDEPPCHLDVDITAWGRYTNPGSENPVIIKRNQEIITIRNILPGEYIVNAHYFSNRECHEHFDVNILVQDVRNKAILYHGDKTLRVQGDEAHFVKFTVVDEGNGNYKVEKIYTDRPQFYINELLKKRGAMTPEEEFGHE